MLKVLCRLMLINVCAAAASHGQTTHGGGASASPVEKILALIPADAQAAVVIPSLKALSDQIAQCLDGMDRGHLMMGSRPIDQLKSSTGFNVGISDTGGLAIIWNEGPGGEPAPLVVVPVSDAQAFLDGNFAAHDGDAHTLTDGRTLYAKALGSHVVLSEDSGAVRGYESGECLSATLMTQLGERGTALLNSGEMFIVARQPAFQHAAQTLKDHAAETARLLPLVEVWSFSLLEQLESGLIVIDFDPLGVISHSLARWKHESFMGRLTAGDRGGSGGSALSSLPSKSFYLACSIDLAGLGGPEAIERLCREAELTDPPPWLLQAQSVQFAAYPSPAGLAGGLLNDAVLVLRTPQPAVARTFLKQQLLALQNADPRITRQVKWEDNKQVVEGVNADAYEVKVTNAAPELAQQQMALGFIFGRAGWRGFVAHTPEAMVMTFSQRPAVLQAALAAIEAARTNPNAGLASDPALKMMRAWLPPQTDIELYIGVGRLGQLAKAAVEGLGAPQPLPEFDPGMPPIGFGLAVDAGGIETASIIPSDVLAVVFDEMKVHITNVDIEAGEPARSTP